MTIADTASDAWVPVPGTVVEGDRVASGAAEDSPFPRGTIEMQLPHFRKRGLDLTDLHPATVNVSTDPRVIELVEPSWTFIGVEWSSDHDPEDFSLSPCRLGHRGETYEGYIYRPHPDTKIGHHKDPDTVEIIAEWIPSLAYGDEIEVLVDPRECRVRTTGD